MWLTIAGTIDGKYFVNEWDWVAFQEFVCKDTPCLPVVHGSVAHELRCSNDFELLSHPQGRVKIMEEADGVREPHVWAKMRVRICLS